MTAPDDIARIVAEVLAIDKKATKGPWRYEPNTDTPSIGTIVGPSFRTTIVKWAYDITMAQSFTRQADAHLIGVYRTAAPQLARAVQAKDAEIERLREDIQIAQNSEMKSLRASAEIQEDLRVEIARLREENDRLQHNQKVAIGEMVRLRRVVEAAKRLNEADHLEETQARFRDLAAALAEADAGEG